MSETAAAANLPDRIFVIVSRDKEAARYEHMQTYFATQPELAARVEYVEPCWVGRDEAAVDISHYSPHLKIKEIMPTESHLKALRTALATTGDTYMICESDSIFPADFMSLLGRVMAEWRGLGEGKSMVYLGDGNGLMPRKHNQKTPLLYEEGATRCVDCMLMTRDCAQALLRGTTTPGKPVTGPVDHYWNTVIREEGIKSYWLHPHELRQGSVTGLFKSHLGA